MATPTKNKIVISLHHSPKCASDIALDLDIVFTNISRNLGAMKEDKLVVHERTGIRKKYKLTPSGNQMYNFLSIHDKDFKKLKKEYEDERKRGKWLPF